MPSRSFRERASAQMQRLASQAAAWNAPVERASAATVLELPRTFAKPTAPSAALPEAAAAKVAQFKDEFSKLGKLGVALAEEQQSLQIEKSNAVARLRELTDPHHAAMTSTTLVGPDHPSALQAKATIAEVDAKLRTNARQQSDVQAQRQPLDQLVRSINEFLSSSSTFGAFKEELDVDEFDIGTVRNEIAALELERRQVMSAPKHSSEAKQTAAAEISALAERGKPDLAQLIQYGGKIEWTQRKIDHPVSGIVVGQDGANSRLVAKAHDGGSDAFALLAWMYEDDLIEAIFDQIDQESDDNSSLTSEQRASRLTEIAAQKLRLERVEEALIEASPSITRRGDADARAVLGLA